MRSWTRRTTTPGDRDDELPRHARETSGPVNLQPLPQGGCQTATFAPRRPERPLPVRENLGQTRNAEKPQKLGKHDGATTPTRLCPRKPYLAPCTRRPGGRPIRTYGVPMVPPAPVGRYACSGMAARRESPVGRQRRPVTWRTLSKRVDPWETRSSPLGTPPSPPALLRTMYTN